MSKNELDLRTPDVAKFAFFLSNGQIMLATACSKDGSVQGIISLGWVNPTSFMPLLISISVGSGPEEKRLRERAASLGLDPSSIFTGMRDDVAEIMELLDVIVIPSISESFGMVALEAMRAARPVVASSVGGLPELVRHGETGLLVSPRSAATLAEAVIAILADADVRRRLGECGRQVFLNEYDLPKCIERTLALYERVNGEAAKH